METKTNQAADNGAKTIQGTTADNSAILVSETTKPNVGTTIDRLITYNDKGTIAIPYTPTEKPKLKNVTQQKRVEQIANLTADLKAATLTIENQALEIKTFEKAFEIKDRTIKKQSDELEKLGETCGNLVRTKLRNEAAIADLTKRNGNLKTIANDQTERIEILQHENKNYESAIAVLEVKETRINELCLAYEKRNQELEGLMSKATESRERLASKFTNWFIFLVLTNIVSIAWGVYQLLTK